MAEAHLASAFHLDSWKTRQSCPSRLLRMLSEQLTILAM